MEHYKAVSEELEDICAELKSKRNSDKNQIKDIRKKLSSLETDTAEGKEKMQIILSKTTEA